MVLIFEVRIESTAAALLVADWVELLLEWSEVVATAAPAGVVDDSGCAEVFVTGLADLVALQLVSVGHLLVVSESYSICVAVAAAAGVE